MRLRGRTILDCSALLPGPFMGKLLAQQGAHVIKIENPDRPDGARVLEGGHFYKDLNECKELKMLNLTKTEDSAQFRELVKSAHGLIEGFRPQAKKKLDLDEATLHQINPKLCIASLVGYPEDGPWADRAGHDMNFSAVTGALSLFKEMPALPLADLFAAYAGALELACALDSVARGGRGTRVVVSMSEVLKDVQSCMISEFQATGKVPKPGETLFSGVYPCYHLYTARDGRRVTVGAIEAKFWHKVCEILGLPDLIPHGYATGEQGARVIAQVQAVFGAKPWSEWAPKFENADCCVEPVLDYGEVYKGM